MKTIQVLQLLNKEAKAEVYLVGGFVRDLLRNKNNTDFDIVVRGMSIRKIMSFLKQYGKVKPVHLSKTNDRLSVSILLFKASGDTLEAQIVLPRRGKKQIPDSHNTLRQDVKFRDFTINCLYLPINYSSKKDVIDLVGGKEDIKRRRITANGDARARIKESPIRMMRAISLAARTGYTIDRELIREIRNNASLITACPVEAVRAEFNKVVMSKKPSRYLRLLNKAGLLKYVAPEVYDCVNVKQDGRYHKYDVFTHLIYTVDHCDSDLVLRLAGLLHDIGKPNTRKEVPVRGGDKRVTFHKHEMVSVKKARDLLRRLRYDLDTTKDVLALVKFHMYHYTRDWTDAAVRKFIRRVGMNESYLDEKNIDSFPLFKLRAAERLGSGLKAEAVTDRQRDFQARLISVFNEGKVMEIRDLEVNGNIIMETFNLKPGVRVGEILKYLLDQVLENPKLNDRLELLKLTTEYLYKE